MASEQCFSLEPHPFCSPLDGCAKICNKLLTSSKKTRALQRRALGGIGREVIHPCSVIVLILPATILLHPKVKCKGRKERGSVP